MSSSSDAESLSALAASDVREAIGKEELEATVSKPPFVYVQGTFNTRDLGLIPKPGPAHKMSLRPRPGQASTSSGGSSAQANNNTTNSNKLRTGFVFRSGGLDRLTKEGQSQMAKQLGIKRVFDLRSKAERGSTPDPKIPGIENVWALSDEADATLNVADFVDGNKAYGHMYLEVLDLYKTPFKGVLEHVRDKPDEPFLFHCTAGRDRTGVLSGLLHSLVGQDSETIVLDYMLSRIGTDSAREILLQFALKNSGAESIETPGFLNLVSLKPSYWKAFAGAVKRKHGSFDGYVLNTLGFSDKDLATIKKNLSA